MYSTHPARPWQLAPVSRFGHVVVAMLCALSLDSAITWRSFASLWIVTALVIPPLLIAIRVARGFDQALPTAISVFIAGAVFAIARLAHGYVSTTAAVSLAIVGIVAAALEIRHSRRQSTIQLTRTNRDGPEPIVARR